jgi:hypothetical protein
MSHSVAVGGIAAGNTEGTIGVLLGAGTPNFS